MALVINEAPEQHPPLPVGFPTCGNYDIGPDGYKKAMAKSGTAARCDLLKIVSLMYDHYYNS